MYLTQIDINPRSRASMKIVGNPRAMHAAVLTMFPQQHHAPTDEGRILWRLDEQPDGPAHLYVVSPTEPDVAAMGKQTGYNPEEQRWRTRPYDALLNHLKAGQSYRFRLDANPSRTVTDPQTGKKSIVGHITTAQQLQWLVDRQERLGISLEGGDGLCTADVVKSRHQRSRKWQQGTTVTQTRATYVGTLTVTDADALRQALTKGIGRGKSYGLGLMTLARTS